MNLFTRIFGVSAFLALVVAARAAEPVDLHATMTAAIIESDGNFAGRVQAKVDTDEDRTFFDAKPFDGLPGRQVIMEVKTLRFLMCDLSDPAAIRAVGEAFSSMPAYKSGLGTYTVEPDAAASSEQKKVTQLFLNRRKVGNLTEYTNGKKTMLTFGPFGGRATAEAAPVAVTPAAAPSNPDAPAPLCDLLLKLMAVAPANFPAITRSNGTKANGSLVYDAAATEGLSGDTFYMVEAPVSRKCTYTVIFKQAAAVERITRAVQALPGLYGSAWSNVTNGRTVETYREAKHLLTLAQRDDGSAILWIGLLVNPEPNQKEIFAAMDALIAQCAGSFQDLTPPLTIRTADVVTRAVPAGLKESKGEAATCDDAFPSYEAIWAETNAEADSVYRSIAAYCTVRVGQHRASLESSTAMAHIYPDSRLIRFDVGDVCVVVEYRMNRYNSRLYLNLYRLTRPSWYRERAEPVKEYAGPAAAPRSNPSGATSSSGMQHTCVRCDGRGTIETTDRYGTHIRQTCPICGGKGYYTN